MMVTWLLFLSVKSLLCQANYVMSDRLFWASMLGMGALFLISTGVPLCGVAYCLSSL